MSEAFTKLFGSITDSTIWCEPNETRLVWITMLAMADRHGYVGASVPGLAHRARVSVESTEAAIAKFLSPDPYSRSQDYEGRRIEEADRGWILLNYGRYRDMRDEEVRKEYERARKRKQRGNPSVPQVVPECPGQTGTVPECPALSAQAEAEAEADPFPTLPPKAYGRQAAVCDTSGEQLPESVVLEESPRVAGRQPTGNRPKPVVIEDDPRFDEFWAAYPQRPNNPKGKARRAWAARVKEGEDPEVMLAGARAYADYVKREGTEPQFVKHAATFLGPDKHYLDDYAEDLDRLVQVYLNGDIAQGFNPEFLRLSGLKGPST